MGSATDKAGVMLGMANVNFVAGPPKTILVDIINSGTSDGTVNALCFGTSESALSSVAISPATITAEGAPVSFTVTANWTASTMYYFKVVPSSGTPLTFNVRSP